MIAAIDAVSSPTPFGSSHLQRYCEQAPQARALVCDAGRHVRGFVLFSTVLDEGSIDKIAVLPLARGLGTGGKLMREALAAMRESGVRRCLLEVRESNLPAQALYARYGFREDGRRVAYYETATGREDAILMSRRL